MFEIKIYDDSNHFDLSVACLIAEAMDVDKKDIEDISALKKGMTNDSFKFTVDEEQYIIRIPGEGTDKLIDRKGECEVYDVIKGSRISDDVVYISAETGHKISRFIEGSRSCDPYDQGDVKLAMEKLKELHRGNFKVSHRFDLYETLDYYEDLRGDVESTYPDYVDTKEKIRSLKSIIEASPRDFVLSHIDPVPDNFLLTREDIRLIDWEYSGMQDPHIDIAMFAVSSGYDKEALDVLIDIYFEDGCEDRVRIKIYCYMAVCGVLWSNWCEYKSLFGVEFDEYSKRQYRYARDYYRIVKEEVEKTGK